MAWLNVSDSTMPGEHEIVEVRLANGTLQLAHFISGIWRVPAVDELTAAFEQPEIKNVTKWRPFAEMKVAYQQKKTQFIERPY